MLNKSIIASAIILSLTGCVTADKTRFVGAPVETTQSTRVNNSESNVMFEYEGEKLQSAKKQSIIKYQTEQKQEVVKVKYRVVDSSDLRDEAITNKEKEITDKRPYFDVFAADSNINDKVATVQVPGEVRGEASSPRGIQAIYSKSENDVSSKVVLENKNRHLKFLPVKSLPVKPQQTISKASAASAPKQYVLTPEDRIMASDIDPLLYQAEVEFKTLLISKTTDRLLAKVDAPQAKAYLINRFYNTDDIETNDREPIERPTSLFTFKGKKGSLKENLEVLLSHSANLRLISDISENHFLDYGFEIQGASVLHILDELVAPFKSPYPVKVNVYSKNKAAHVYYAK